MLGGISIWQLIIILVIVALIFGTKKLRGMGGDLGGAVKGFKKAMSDDAEKTKEDIIEKATEEADQKTTGTTVEETEKVKKS